jgi:hypothetical protein
MLHAVFQDKSVSEAREMVMRFPLGRGDFIFYAQSQTSSYPDHIEHGHVVCDLVRETEVVAENIWKLYERRDAVSRRSSSFRFKPSTIGSPARATYLLPSHRFKGFLFFLLTKHQLQHCPGPRIYVVCLCHFNPRVQIMSQVQCFALQLHRALCGSFLESGCRFV